MRRTRALIPGIAVLALAALAGRAPADSYRLAQELTAEEPAVRFALPADGAIPLTIFPPGPGDGRSPVDLVLGGFAGEDGKVLEAELVHGDARARTLTGIEPEVGPLRITLAVNPPGVRGEFHGKLVLVQDGAPVRVWNLTLYSPAESPVTLRGDTDALAAAVTLTTWRNAPFAEHALTTTLRGSGGPVRGLRVQPVAPADEADLHLDLIRNLVLHVNGQPFDPLAPVTPDADLGDQVVVQVGFRNLTPGRYRSTLMFSSLETGESDRHPVRLQVTVKDHPFWALLTLVAGILLSWIGTKGLQSRTQRLELLNRIQNVRPAWLKSEPPTALLISYVARLRQIEDRCRGFLLSGVDSLRESLQEAERVLPVLSRVRSIRKAMEDSDIPEMAKKQFYSRLRRLLRRLGTNPTSEESLRTALEDLDGLHPWFELHTDPAPFAAAVGASVDRLLAEYRLDTFTTAASAQLGSDAGPIIAVATSLHDALTAAAPPTTLRGILALQQEYLWLKMLWSCRNGPELCGLATLSPRTHSLQELLRVTDLAASERLLQAPSSLYFKEPRANPGAAPEAYETISFALGLRNEPDDTYFFRHGLEFQWDIQLPEPPKPKPWRRWLHRGPAPTNRLTPVTNEPRVIQFAPRHGTLKASVVVLTPAGRTTEPVRLDPPLGVRPSSVFGVFKAFQWNEGIATALAGVFALVIGLGQYYLDDPTFGSLRDYLTLFLWGAAVDQSKNFLQLLQKPAEASTYRATATERAP